MAKAPKRLNIVALDLVYAWPELEKLRLQGHNVLQYRGEPTLEWLREFYIAVSDADVILGPTCWRMDEAHRKFLPMAIAAARRIKYPPKKGEPEDE